MSLDRKQLAGELAAAGLPVLGVSDDGRAAFRRPDGSEFVIAGDGSAGEPGDWTPPTSAELSAYQAVRAAHAPTPRPQRPPLRAALRALAKAQAGDPLTAAESDLLDRLRGGAS